MPTPNASKEQLTLFSSVRVAIVRATETRYGGGRQVMASKTQVRNIETSALFLLRPRGHPCEAGCCGVLTLAEAFLREPATEDLIELASIVLYYYYFCAKSRAGEIHKETKEMSYAAVSR